MHQRTHRHSVPQVPRKYGVVKLPRNISRDDDKEKLIHCVPLTRRRIEEFARDSTIHGLLQILRRDQTAFGRVLWTLAFIVAVGGGLFLVGRSLNRYLQYDIKSTMTMKMEKEIDFPAITFCNENMLKRSMVGGSEEVINAFTALMISNVKDFQVKKQRAMDTCFTNVTNAQTDQYHTMGYEYMKSLGMSRLMQLFALDSDKSVLDCWWADEPWNCSNRFLNHITDYGWCFTLNPSPKLLKSFPIGFGPFHTGYGIDKDLENLVLHATGPNNGFKILLDAHQDEYCVTRSDAAGFKALIHDPSVQPMFLLEKPISLSPGFETNVAIRYTRRVKETEDLGKCVSFKELLLYPKADFYFKEACYLDCFTKFVFQSCKCTPLYGPPGAHRQFAKQSNFTNYVRICWEQKEILCMKTQERQFLDLGVHKECSHCLDPCKFTTYDIQMSTSYFPGNNFFRLYHGRLNQTYDKRGNSTFARRENAYLRTNLALVSFYVESMQINEITETQAISGDQLLADIGGQVGFLLGMSILSIFEFVDCFLPRKKVIRTRRRGGMGDTLAAYSKNSVRPTQHVA